jgi:sarcosine oxidase
MSADVGVVGAGIVGLATAYALTERGASVTVYERGAPGRAQSGGAARIFRHAHDDPRLAAFARDSRAVWDAWSEAFGTELVSSDGAVALGDAAGRRLAALAGVEGLALRPLDAGELRERLPVLAGFDGPAMLDERGGAIRTTAAVEALCRALAGSIVADEVLAARPTGPGTAEVLAGGLRAEHERVVVCAGQSTAGLAAGLGLTVPVRHAAHVRLAFAVRDPPARLACLQDGSGAFGETPVYAAAEPGNRRLAVGLSASVDLREGGVADPDALAGHARRVTDYVRRALPGLDPEPVGIRHCTETALPWGDDGLAVWEAGPVLAVAGHNLFKQAPALGRALAGAAVGDGLPDGLRPEARLGARRD